MELKIFQSSIGQVSYRLIGQGERKILYFHGFPGSSAQIRNFLTSTTALNLQVLCFDRPGYNRTEIKTNDSLQDTIKITQELTTFLQWSSCEVVTVSGGTPFGLFLAIQFPNFVKQIRIICGLGYLKNKKVNQCFSRFKIFSLFAIQFIPGFILKAIVTPSEKSQSSSQLTSLKTKFFELFYPASQADRQIAAVANMQSSLNLILKESVLFHALGPQQDAQVFLSNWGENLNSIYLPVHFWHGDEDYVISNTVSKIMSDLISNSKLTIVKSEGHMSLPVRQINNILKTDI